MGGQFKYLLVIRKRKKNEKKTNQHKRRREKTTNATSALGNSMYTNKTNKFKNKQKRSIPENMLV